MLHARSTGTRQFCAVGQRARNQDRHRGEPKTPGRPGWRLRTLREGADPVGPGFHAGGSPLRGRSPLEERRRLCPRTRGWRARHRPCPRLPESTGTEGTGTQSTGTQPCRALLQPRLTRGRGAPGSRSGAAGGRTGPGALNPGSSPPRRHPPHFSRHRRHGLVPQRLPFGHGCAHIRAGGSAHRTTPRLPLPLPLPMPRRGRLPGGAPSAPRHGPAAAPPAPTLPAPPRCRCPRRVRSSAAAAASSLTAAGGREGGEGPGAACRPGSAAIFGRRLPPPPPPPPAGGSSPPSPRGGSPRRAPAGSCPHLRWICSPRAAGSTSSRRPALRGAEPPRPQGAAGHSRRFGGFWGLVPAGRPRTP